MADSRSFQALRFSRLSRIISSPYDSIMASVDKTRRENAQWNEAETAALLEFLVQNVGRAGEAGSFKDAVFKEAAVAIQPHHTKGAAKTPKHCRSKWNALKSTHSAIERYRSLSGFTWSDENGAGVDDGSPASVQAWNEYTKQPTTLCQAIKPFRNRGWPYLNTISLIVPSTARGDNAFHPAATEGGSMAPGASAPPPAMSPALQGDIDIVLGDADSHMASVSVQSSPAPSPPPSALTSRAPSVHSNASGKRKRSAVEPEVSADSLSVRSASTSNSTAFSSAVGPSGSKRSAKGPNRNAIITDLIETTGRIENLVNTTLQAPEEAAVQRKERAITLIQDRQVEDGYTRDEAIELLRILEAVPTLYVTYLVLRPAFRISWVRSILANPPAAAAK